MAKHWVYDDERLKNVTQPGWSLLRPSAHLPTAFFPGPFPWWGLGEGGSSQKGRWGSELVGDMVAHNDNSFSLSLSFIP